MWILCKYQENEFGHIVGRHDELHPVSNTFLGTGLPTKNKEWYILIMKEFSLNFLEGEKKTNNCSHCNCWVCPWHFASVLVWNLSYFLCDAFHLFRHIASVTCKIAIGSYLMCNLLRKYWVIYMRSEVSFWFQLHLTLQSHLYSSCFWDLLFVYEIKNCNFSYIL